MGMDEALLESVASLDAPVLRFYGWSEPAASFGYFQKYNEIASATALRPLVRRPTGGGLVPHDADWTYSVVVPPHYEWYSLSASDSYIRIHKWIQAAFEKLKIPTELAPCCKKTTPGQCFVGYEKFDVLHHGAKIGGAAQRRTRAGLLIQGSVQPNVLRSSRTEWERAMCEVASAWSFQFLSLPVNQTPNHRADELADQKYSRPSYNCRR